MKTPSAKLHGKEPTTRKRRMRMRRRRRRKKKKWTSQYEKI
jgi:hypothetical protein